MSDELPLPPPPSAERKRKYDPSSRSGSRLDAWTLWGAILMLVGAFLPYFQIPPILDAGREPEASWIWDQVERALSWNGGGYAGYWWATLLLLPVAVALIMIFVLRAGREPNRSWLLIGIPAIAWTLRWTPRWGTEALSYFGEINLNFGGGMVFAVALGCASALLSARDRPAVRATVALCGIAVLIGLLAPGPNEEPLILAPFDAELWDTSFWVIGAAVLMNILFVALALSMFRSKADVSGTARLLLGLGALMVVGLPFAQVSDGPNGPRFLDLMNATKMACGSVGPLILFAAGVRRFIDLVSPRGEEMPEIFT